MNLSVINNGDGTATVAISDGDDLATYTVLSVRVGEAWGSGISWNEEGTRIGNGDVTIATGSGAYWFYASGDNDEVSVPVYQFVSDGTVNVWHQILDAVQARIRGLMLDGVNNANVETLEILDEAAVKQVRAADRILISIAGGETLTTGGPLQRDNWQYPVLIAHVKAINTKETTDQEKRRWFLIRERIRQSLIWQPLNVSPAHVWCDTFRTLDPIQRGFWDMGIFASMLIPQFVSREPRGT